MILILLKAINVERLKQKRFMVSFLKIKKELEEKLKWLPSL